MGLFAALLLNACEPRAPATNDDPEFDVLIQNGWVFEGNPDSAPSIKDVGIKADRIILVGAAGDKQAARTIDASGLLVTAGFIDPHTHSLDDLKDPDRRANLNYLTQGVTTVVNGNDGGGGPDIAAQAAILESAGIGTNTAFFVGHGTIRRLVMGGDNRAPTANELAEMQRLVDRAMSDGALGLSAGLYYTPGNFATTDEVVELAKVAAAHGGIYDSHLRDESSYSIGLLGAVDEALEIGKRAGIPVHLAHIKALGVDVWGESTSVIERIEAALEDGVAVSADQYPWAASGTRLHNALLPRSFLDGESEAFVEKLQDPDTQAQLTDAVTENLRRRGGPASILFVDASQPQLDGKTLADVAGDRDAIATAFDILRLGSVRIASFNMNAEDIETFMAQPWVMTSSDGTNGHPRKYASFPQKYEQYVRDNPILRLEEFLHRSSALTAQTLNLENRGTIKNGFIADIVVLDLDKYSANAGFEQWNRLSSGVIYSIVNGQLVIDAGQPTNNLPGRVLRRSGVNN